MHVSDEDYEATIIVDVDLRAIFHHSAYDEEDDFTTESFYFSCSLDFMCSVDLTNIYIYMM